MPIIPTPGTDAALGGMSLVPGVGEASDLDEYLNQTRDYGANGPAYWKAGLVLTSPKAANARTALGCPATAETVVNGDTTKPLRLTYTSAARAMLRINGVDRGEVAYVADVDGVYAAVNGRVARTGDTVTGGLGVNGAFTNPYARANGVSGWLALGVNAAGQFGFQLSSRKFKKDITSWAPDKQAVLAMRLVEFHYKVAFDDGSGAVDQGLIAEELHDLGLTWLVAYGDDGDPVTVRYDRIGLALLPIVQDHESRLAALEAARS